MKVFQNIKVTESKEKRLFRRIASHSDGQKIACPFRSKGSLDDSQEQMARCNPQLILFNLYICMNLPESSFKLTASTPDVYLLYPATG
jgi:hypothetical protein